MKDDDMTNFRGQFVYDRNDIDLENVRRLKNSLIETRGFTAWQESGEFAYLNAERIGPRVTQQLPSGGEGLDGKVGKFGQFTAAILARAYRADEKVWGWDDTVESKFLTALSNLDGDALIPDFQTSEGSLFRLANVMLGWIVPGAVFIASENDDTDTAVVAFTRDAKGTKTKTRATHVGFGLSYALPIIAGALALSGGGVLLVENPEAHLHPFSQSRMGAFLALMSATNRQIFVETHSDHVVNGIRLAVRHKLVSPESVRIYFFRNSLAAEQSEISEITVDDSGGVASWPPGFFDQIEQDLAKL